MSTFTLLKEEFGIPEDLGLETNSILLPVNQTEEKKDTK